MRVSSFKFGRTGRVRRDQTPPAGRAGPAGGRPIVEPLERRRLLSAVTYAGPLDGKIVYLNGGHGFAYDGSVWRTGRGETNEMVEDFGNQDQLRSYADYLLRAGATVVPLRPVGHQLNEVVLDNDSPGVTFAGPWSDSAATAGFYGSAGDVPYRFAGLSAAETATATYAPALPQAGFYPVYAWARDGTDRATDHLYRVNYAGGSAEVTVNHKLVGEGWVYLGTYYFEAGAGGSVQVSNRSGDASGVVIADAVRFGNGMGSVRRNNATSGRSREDEAALYWLEAANGVGTNFNTFRGGLADDDSANVGAPARYAAYMNNAPVGQAVYMGFHSNAGGGTGRGTIGLFNSSANATPNQARWAFLAANEVNDDLVALGSPPLEVGWFNRSDAAVTLDRADIDFGEISDNANADEFDATILEVAFHDNVDDAALMRDPKVREAVGRATYQATVRYFNEFGGSGLTMAPAAPTGVRTAVAANGDLTLNWLAPTANAVAGGAATGYVVYASRNGYGFDVVGTVSGGATSYTIPAARLDGGAYYFQVAATNAGGASPGSVVVGARRGSTPNATNRVLVVNGFDRLDRTQNARQPVALVTGGAAATVDRVWPRVGNSFDYVVQAGQAIAAYARAPLGFDSAQSADVAAGRVDLARYQTVVWLSGEESTADETFDAAEQAAVAAYLTGGGRLFASGSEIGWDLGRATGPTAADRAFLGGSLRVGLGADDADTYRVGGGYPGSAFDGISPFTFDNGSGDTYHVDFPDRLTAANGSVPALGYDASTAAVPPGYAGVQYADPAAGGQRVVTLGFPFEAITTAANRASVMARVLDFFETAVTPAPGAPDLTFGTDTGSNSGDNLTRNNNATAARALSFTVAGALTDAVLRVYADGQLVGTRLPPNGLPATVTTDGATALADGVRRFTVTQELPNQSESAPSAPLLVTIDTAAPAAPAAPDLRPGSDAGPSDADDLTNDATPTLGGPVPAGEAFTVRLFDNGGQVAIGQAAGGAWSLTPAAPLGNGVHAFTATLTDAAGNASAPSAALAVTIDTTGPAVVGVAVNDGAAQRSMVTRVAVTFDRAVYLGPGDAFAVVRQSDQLAVPVTATNPAGDGRTWVLAFGGADVVGGSLPDGRYDLNVRAARVGDVFGQAARADHASMFHRYFGDADGDRDVDSLDSRRFRAALGTDASMAAYNPIFDFDADGDVDSLDSRRFRLRLGTEI